MPYGSRLRDALPFRFLPLRLARGDVDCGKRLDAGTILWNGANIDQGGLVTNLQQSKELPVEPELQFEPDPQASYDLSAKVLNIIKASKVTKSGFVGNERYAVFGKAPNAH